MVILHCGRNGHRDVHVVENPFGRYSTLVVSRSARERTLLPRPFSESHHTFERNATLLWNFLTLGDSFGSPRYVLVLKDEATHFVELVACDSPTSTVAATAILDWYSRFGVTKLWEFILAYSPWKNGSVERVNRDILNRDILQVLKALALEFCVSLHDWPYLLPLVRFSIKPTVRLSNFSPVTVPQHIGRVATLSNPWPNTEKQLAGLRESIMTMHKSVEAERKKQGRRYRTRPTSSKM
ncbi:Hypothetical protein PHPALM_11702 [Phytophthora palmivora]|uniref:Integrase catalytic domain-containing protein n=1 Tax=Phytophthora palmivora TaxID=4796 RepID=A0A2P4Y1W1_9STRA|nr:Hypothetical protein PHPALM_11702 [Phytophthora palmivora]